MKKIKVDLEEILNDIEFFRQNHGYLLYAVEYEIMEYLREKYYKHREKNRKRKKVN